MVTTRPRGDGWQYDIIFSWPDGTKFRERKQAPIKSKSGAQRWAEARERELISKGQAVAAPPEEPTVPTLAEFWPRVVTDHYEANRRKASTTEAAKTIYKQHLGPALGTKPLHLITTADVAALKGRLVSKRPKTTNNVLSVLSRALRCAVAWGVIPSLPCAFGLLRNAEDEAAFYEPHDYLRLIHAARKIGTTELVLVLLAGSAGLRRGELQALRWSDLDLARGQMRVRNALWERHADDRVEDSPKGNRGRTVPLTAELVEALKAHRHVRSERVLVWRDGRELTNKMVRLMMESIERRAVMPVTGAVHILRHTFCSHLAIAGVPAKAIQELAGHADLKTTLRYMHLSPAMKSEAVGALAGLYASTLRRGTYVVQEAK